MFDHDKFRKDIHNGSKNEDEKTGILEFLRSEHFRRSKLMNWGGR